METLQKTLRKSPLLVFYLEESSSKIQSSKLFSSFLLQKPFLQQQTAEMQLKVCWTATLTCSWVDREEILRVASSDAITQAAGSGGEIRVLRLDTDD